MGKKTNRKTANKTYRKTQDIRIQESGIRNHRHGLQNTGIKETDTNNS